MDDKQQRINRCLEKINKALDEEQCVLLPSITIIGNKVAKDEILVYAKNIAQQQPEIKPVEEATKEVEQPQSEGGTD